MNSQKMPGKRSVGWAAHCSGWGSITSPGIGDMGCRQGFAGKAATVTVLYKF